MSQFSMPCSVYRGGTSRGLFFRAKDLPKDKKQRDHIFMRGIDSYNPSQIDGLGSGTSHTSKVCVISDSSVEGADIDFTFYQIGIGVEVVDDLGTCGNLMAGVGAFAVDEGLVQVDAGSELVDVYVFNTNIQKMLKLQVPVVDGKAKVSGDYLMPGIAKTGAKFMVDVLSPGGGKTGKTLPVGARYSIKTKNGSYDVSFVDVVNPFVFVSAHALNIKGTEPNSELSRNLPLVEELEAIRSEVAVAAGMAKTLEDVSPAVPKIAIIVELQDYVTSTGKVIKKEDVDVVAKMVSMGKFHRTFAGSGLYCVAAAVLLPGTIPNEYARERNGIKEQLIRVGHPEGVVEVRVSLTDDTRDVASVGMERTARRIMKGELYIPVD